MPVGSYCRRSPCTAQLDETLQASAERMEKEGVGLLVVVDGGWPVGVLSDRDVALEVLAGRRDPVATRVADAMTKKPVTVPADAPLGEAALRMSRQGVRRLPVVNVEDRLVGVIAADDLVRVLADEIGALAAVVTAQLPVGAESARLPEEEGAVRQVAHYGGEVVHARADATVRALAEAMREHTVGCVVVTGDAEEPVGVVTDRDLALRVVAKGLDPDATQASAVMSAPVITAQAGDPIETVVATMRSRGVRRIPIVRDGRLSGIVAFDDLLVAFGEELQRLGRAAVRDVRSERRHVQAERLRSEVEERLRDLGTRLQDVGDKTLRGVAREFEALREKLKRSGD
jgi:CBS domain-containing protein